MSSRNWTDDLLRESPRDSSAIFCEVQRTGFLPPPPKVERPAGPVRRNHRGLKATVNDIYCRSEDKSGVKT